VNIVRRPCSDSIGYSYVTSGAGTNLNVEGTGPARKWGAPIRRRAP